MPDRNADSLPLSPLRADAGSLIEVPQASTVPVAPSDLPLAGPSPLWLAAGFVLAGIGTVLLGPLLPWLSTAWSLSDAQGGALLAVKFVGSFLGGFTVLSRLRLGILLGAILCATGFGFFAVSGSFAAGSVGLFVGGYGLGQIIASTNILVGHRYKRQAGSALALLNLFWSLGAVIAGLLAALLLPTFGMRGPLLTFSSLFLFTGLAGAYGGWKTGQPGEPSSAPGAASSSLPARTLLHFGLLLFLYGGLETSLSGWLTTYTIRFSAAPWLGGQSAIILLWSALTAGRGLTSLAMRFWSETRVRAAGLILALLALTGLFTASRQSVYLSACVILGLSLAPYFPASFARLVQHRPSAQVSGRILAISGLGAALFPWLVGIVSTRSGSLRLALAIPFLLTGTLLVLSFFEPECEPVHFGSSNVL